MHVSRGIGVLVFTSAKHTRMVFGKGVSSNGPDGSFQNATVCIGATQRKMDEASPLLSFSFVNSVYAWMEKM